MSIVQESWLRHVLTGVDSRVELAAEVLDWADGKAQFAQDELVPQPTDEESLKAWERFTRQVQNLAPRAIAFKKSSAVGVVNWGDDDPGNIDSRLEDMNLHGLAERLLKNLVALGIAGVIPHVPEVGQPRLQRLGGYIEPLYNEDDREEPSAWFQVTDEMDGKSFRLRIYEPNPADPILGTVTEWRNQRNAYTVGNPPSAVHENVFMPAVVMVDTDQAGMPIGELEQALPLLKSEVAQQIKNLRATDTHTWPVRWAAGDWDITETLSAGDVLVAGDPSSKIGIIDPPNLEMLFTHHDRILERIRGDLKLPISSISTGNFPSGEALEQANAISIAQASRYASHLSELLTQGVERFAVALGMTADDAPHVSVTIDTEQSRRVVSDQVRNDWREGLISFRVAVNTISQFYKDWKPKDIEAFIADGEGVIPDEPGMSEAAEVPEP